MTFLIIFQYLPNQCSYLVHLGQRTGGRLNRTPSHGTDYIGDIVNGKLGKSLLLLAICVGISELSLSWHNHLMSVHAQSSTLPFADMFTPAASETVAAQTWVGQVQGDLNDHETRIKSLEATVAQLQAQLNPPPSQLPVVIPITSYVSIKGGPSAQPAVCGQIICNTQTGETITYNIPSLPAGAYKVSITAAGTGLAAVVVNGASQLLPAFGSSQVTNAVTITWPGGSGTIQLVVTEAWINFSNLVIGQ